MPSRRALLGALATTPIAISATAISPWQETLTGLYRDYDDSPVVLRRTKDGRSQSEFRYHNAEEFFDSIERRPIHDRSNLLYQTGIVMQLGLSSHLFDVGFTDDWCKPHVGLRVTKSLAYANATGFGYDDPDTNLLAAILTPYGKWRNAMWGQRNDDGPFTQAEICRLTRALLERVHDVTGHSRPHWWRARHG